MTTFNDRATEILVAYGRYVANSDKLPERFKRMDFDQALAELNKLHEKEQQESYHNGYKQGRFDEHIESIYPQEDRLNPTEAQDE